MFYIKIFENIIFDGTQLKNYLNDIVQFTFIKGGWVFPHTHIIESLPGIQVLLSASSHSRKGPQIGNPMPQVSPICSRSEKVRRKRWLYWQS